MTNDKTTYNDGFRDGVRAAAGFAGDWDMHIMSPYKFEDIVLGKFGLLKKSKMRRKPHVKLVKKFGIAGNRLRGSLDGDEVTLFFRAKVDAMDFLDWLCTATVPKKV